ncbi:MAG TPA: EscS/YscS/HrcS family type III secretion system export apparatus protein [Gammaproteobacteria bacterium]|nr:EscS/YscS/HrcS family type III secretion system export apparatus protein [Gammaproteobacteria bacterium]
MGPDAFFTIFQQTLQLLVILVSLLLLPVLGVGLIISMFQAATQINEMTLTFVPKILVLFLTLLLAGPWISQVMVTFSNNLFLQIPGMMG